MTDDAVLDDQYADSARLSARQSLWRYRTGPALHTTVLDLASLTGVEAIVDVGCGNGAYLAELVRREHTGPVVGLDRSAAMARRSATHTPTLVGDAEALPIGDHSVDVVLCLHMLYHVPDINRAVRELRRVLCPGGTAMVTTNGPGHTIEAKRILAMAARQVAGIDVDLDWDTHRFPPAYARAVLADAFENIDVYEVGDTTDVPDPAVIASYLASWPPESIGLHTGPLWHRILAATRELVANHFATDPCFPITSRVAILRCR